MKIAKHLESRNDQRPGFDPVLPPSPRRLYDRVDRSIPANLRCSNNLARIKADPPWSCIVSAQTPTE